MADHCCERMTRNVDAHCDKHTDPFECPDALIVYVPKFDEFGLIIHDGGTSYILIRYCPFCGSELPLSKRDDWFERLEELGIEPGDNDLPAELNSDRWYR